MTEAVVRRREVRRVLWITLALNLLVSLSKVVVGKLSGSLSMVADGYHSLVDGSNNVIGLFVVGLAYAPPDRGHHYGHRKFETAATLGIGLALLALAYRVVEGAFRGVRHDVHPEIGALNWVVMGATLAANLFVAAYEAREGRRLNSEYLTADAAHTRSDIYVTLGVVASFAGVEAGLPWVDSLVAAGIAVFIAFLAVRILVSAFHVLTDRAAIPPERIAAVVEAVPGVRSCREARTRGAPGSVYVDLVALVDGARSLSEAHTVSDRVEDAVRAAFPEVVDVVVHLEPW
ncbi:MAG TPA: cation diffusion facilitator family transporter [Vicinamibacteria bacterium]|nr:cation diffusion facilitator family transporter [Vicinamibacteria bacterium]